MGVRYQTTYTYDEPISLSAHEVQPFPRGDHLTRVRPLDFRRNTNANVRFGRDVFDNNIVCFAFTDRVTKLQFHRHAFSVLKPYRTRRTSDANSTLHRKRTIALALKLPQARVFEEEANTPPLLLIDDIYEARSQSTQPIARTPAESVPKICDGDFSRLA